MPTLAPVYRSVATVLLYNAAWYAWLRGSFSDAEKMSVKLMKVRKKQLGQEDSETLSSQAMVALTYHLGGRWKEAEELFVQVVETRKRVLGQEHPDTLISMNNLAWTWKGQNRDAEALELISSCLELRRSRPKVLPVVRARVAVVH
jgi:hypothetical protein